jgi:hypothetical protein
VLLGLAALLPGHAGMARVVVGELVGLFFFLFFFVFTGRADRGWMTLIAHRTAGDPGDRGF